MIFNNKEPEVVYGLPFSCCCCLPACLPEGIDYLFWGLRVIMQRVPADLEIGCEAWDY